MKSLNLNSSLIYAALVVLILCLLIPGVAADNGWTEVTNHAEWSERAYFGTVVLPDGSVVLMGGRDSKDVLKNDVWQSDDGGATWTQVTAHAEWSPRYLQRTLALQDGSILLIGGTDSSGDLTDVWRSTDQGATWTRLTSNPGWSSRESPDCVVMPDGSIIVSGGTLPGGYTQFNDVWKSSDNGATWSLVTQQAAWIGRYGHAGVVMPDGSIIMAGGFSYGPSYQNDVWRSRDNGLTWMEQTSNAGWSPRYFQSMVVLEDGSILLAGGGINNYCRNDLWQSYDNGITWKQLMNSAGWTGRMGQEMVILPDGNVVLMGGYDGQYHNDVWQWTPGTSNSGQTGAQIGKDSNVIIIKTVSPQSIKKDTEAGINITLKNTGSTPIHDIQILDSTRPEFPVTGGQTSLSIPGELMPNETRTLAYTIRATKAGKYFLNGTSVLYAGSDGNYHTLRSNVPSLSVIEPLITPDQSSTGTDIGHIILNFFRGLFP